MNINLTSIVVWLSQARNYLFVLITISGVMGTLYWAPNIYGRKRIVLIKLTQCLFTGIVGGLGGGISLVATGIPIALLLGPHPHANLYPNESAVDFIRFLFTSVSLDTVPKALPQLFLGGFVFGLLLGLGIGIFSGGVPQPNKPRTAKALSSPAQSHISQHNAISWCILGSGIGLAFGLTFGPLIGLLAGFSLGLLAFLLGLSPRPVQANTSSRKTVAIKNLRVFGFWITVTAPIVLVLIRLTQLIATNPIISLFLLLVLLVFFGFLFLQGVRIEQQRFTVKAISERDENGLYQSTQRLLVTRSKLRSALIMGLVCGILLYSVAFGLPITFFMVEKLGFGVGVVVETIFSILGLGLGTTYGLIFMCIYAVGPVIAFRIERSSDKMLEMVGVTLVILSIVLGVVQYFV